MPNLHELGPNARLDGRRGSHKLTSAYKAPRSDPSKVKIQREVRAVLIERLEEATRYGRLTLSLEQMGDLFLALFPEDYEPGEWWLEDQEEEAARPGLFDDVPAPSSAEHAELAEQKLDEAVRRVQAWRSERAASTTSASGPN